MFNNYLEGCYCATVCILGAIIIKWVPSLRSRHLAHWENQPLRGLPCFIFPAIEMVTATECGSSVCNILLKLFFPQTSPQEADSVVPGSNVIVGKDKALCLELCKYSGGASQLLSHIHCQPSQIHPGGSELSTRRISSSTCGQQES